MPISDEHIGDAVRAALKAHPMRDHLVADTVPLLNDPRPHGQPALVSVLGAFVVVAVAAVLAVVLATRSGVTTRIAATGSGSPSLAGTSTSTPPPSAPSAGVATIATVELGWTFGRPSSWTIVEPAHVVRPGPYFFLTNADSSSVSASGACAFCPPVSTLPADGVLVTFWSSAVFDPSSWNLPVHAVKSDGYCDSLAPDEILTTTIGDTHITACLHGPDLAASEAQFQDFVASITK